MARDVPRSVTNSVRVLGLIVATAVAYSRVHTGVHYPGDVMAGALIGAGMGSLTYHVARRITPTPVE